MLTLRPYQQEAVDAVISHVRQSTDPCLIDAATGAGKSLIVAEIARIIKEISGKKVLCLAPDANLTKQNVDKFKKQAGPCSVFSASIGRSLRHDVVFGTPVTVRNRISRFGDDFAMVVIDECHGITPTIKHIIDAIKERNPNLRVVGLTATPYRLNEGYIFEQFPDGSFVNDDLIKEPYFKKCVYRIHAKTLIDLGYLTKPTIGKIGAGEYKTKGLNVNNKVAVDRAFLGHGRLTSQIVSDIVAQSQGKMGVAIYAATIKHAEEIMASLPPDLSILVTGKEKDNNAKLKLFEQRKVKYVVNVQMLTTGWDAPHIDVIAIMRKTQSVGLLQQIIGRGLRLHDDKDDVLILDYAENLSQHCPDGELFDPEVSALKSKTNEMPPTNAECETCGFVNEFSSRPNPDEFDVDDNGYFLDLMGSRIMTEHGPTPAHYGRRCLGLVGNDRCEGRWTSKECPHCFEPNDISAKYCISCKGEIIDPNDALRLEFKQLKRDPSRPQCDKIEGWTLRDGVSKAGNEQWRVDIVTPYRRFSIWVLKEPKSDGGYIQKNLLMKATNDLTTQPDTVRYVKEKSGFFRVLGWNLQEDKIDDTA